MIRPASAYGLWKIIALLTFVFIFGCTTSQGEGKIVEGPTEKGNTFALTAKANKLIGQADSREKVLELIHTYESVLKIDPAHYEALWSLGSYYLLVGTAYPDSMYEKELYYKKAMKFCERAMYSNPYFRGRAGQGEEPWEACGALSKEEIEAMYYWYKASIAYWSECLGRTGKLFNRSIPSRFKKMMKRMGDVDPSWEEGRVYYAKALYYSMLSDFYGGDVLRASYYFKKCIKEGPDWLSRRWGRAKYLYIRNDNRKGFREDLEWVIARDPKSAKGPYPWNVYFQRDARKMLGKIDDYF